MHVYHSLCVCVCVVAFNSRSFISSKLNSRTSIKKVWDMVRKIRGKGKSSSQGHLNVNNSKVTSKKDILILSLMYFEKFFF